MDSYLFEKRIQSLKRPVVVVLDNAPCHSRIEKILLEEEFKDHKFLGLAPYSPMFNPIGHA